MPETSETTFKVALANIVEQLQCQSFYSVTRTIRDLIKMSKGQEHPSRQSYPGWTDQRFDDLVTAATFLDGAIEQFVIEYNKGLIT